MLNHKEFEIIKQKENFKETEKIWEDKQNGIDFPEWINEKISKDVEKYGLSIHTIINDPKILFCLKYAKKANRQNIGEQLQIDTIQKSGIPIQKLNSNSYSSKRFCNGNIINKKEPNCTKAFDAQVNNIFFLSLKFTKDTSGGSQDYSFHDLRSFMQEAVNYVNKHDDDLIFIAIADGGYYDDTDKLNELNILEIPDKVFACSTEGFIEWYNNK